MKSKWNKRIVPLLALVLGGWILLLMSRNIPAMADTHSIPEIRTMDTQTILCAQAEPGSHVDVTVYAVRENNTRIILFSSRLIVGESGLYQISIPLPIEGEQYVSTSINNHVETRRYTRYPASLQEDLMGTYLNVYEFLQGGQ